MAIIANRFIIFKTDFEYNMSLFNSVILGHVKKGGKRSQRTTMADPFSLVNLYLHPDNVKFKVPEELLVLGDPIDPELGIQPFKVGIG